MTRRTKTELEADNTRLHAALSWFLRRHRDNECIDDEFCMLCEIARQGFGEAA